MIRAYEFPISEGAPQSLVRALSRAHTKTVHLQSKIVAAKAIGAFATMRAQRGVSSDLLMTLQQHLLGGAQRQTRVVSKEYLRTTGRTDILTGKVEGLYGEIAGLKQELRDRPVVVHTDPFKFPDLSGLKTPLIVAAVAIGGLLLLPSLIGAFKK